MSFVHLHCHSEYSLLDGLNKIKPMVARAKALGMPGLALTDHGAMFGAVEFYRACRAEGLRPVIGMEAYMATRRMTDRDPHQDSKQFHLLLLAENETGYRNLLQIATASQLNGFYYRPRIDHEFLAAHAQGLICTTGCLSAEVPRALAEGREAEARRRLERYVDVFGPQNFFVEVQDHAVPELHPVNRTLLDLSKHYGLRTVATNDVHYLRPEDHALHDVLLCIQTGTLVSQTDRMRMSDNSYYMRSPEEMQRLFGEIPGALANTVEIAERCAVDLELHGFRLPAFEVPEGFTPDSYLRHLCEAGLRRRYDADVDRPNVRQRLTHELDVIQRMGFETYFLIVWDLCRFAREAGIWYNARGSAAGSIVAYCLDITMVDPIAHGLIFERFLNPGRVSMPDIDLDFRDDLRPRMLEYAVRKYGEDKVAQIVTFGTLGARAAVRDVGRVLDIPLPDVDRVAKLIPQIPGKPVTIQQALDEVPAFRQAVEGEATVRQMVETAAQLEGVARNAGTHAAGVIITDRPIVEYLPLHRPTKGSEDSPIGAITQFDMEVLSSLGLLKVDFLGLATLTVMARACELIEQRHGVRYDMASLPTDDPRIFDLLGRGDVAGVFQVEGAGMRRYLMDMRPTRLDHVIAMVALYRPGPMDFIPRYIRRMHGQEGVDYRHPALETIFQDTYGIPVYQEQLMRAAVELAGYTLPEADELRQAISKKQKDKLLKHQAKFVEGASQGGMPRETAEAIFADWEEFARYGFNKSHAADYGVIACQTAFLKAVYPAEYMTALLSVSQHDTDKVALYVADCRRMGLAVLPPEVNRSQLDFTIEDRPEGKPSVRFGLGAVKNVGEGPVAALMRARGADGPFGSLDDLAQRVDLRLVGKRALESLIKVGALDAFGKRTAILDSLDRLVSASGTHFRAAEAGQISLFGALGGALDTVKLSASVSDVPRREQLNWEKELLGLYVSDHPLSPVIDELRDAATHFSGELTEDMQGQAVRVAGLITSIRPYQTKSGKAMGFVALEDLQSTLELVVFPRAWEKVAGWLKTDQIVVVDGKVDAQGGTPKILVDSISTQLDVVKPAPPAAPARPSHGNGRPIDEPDPSELWGEAPAAWGPEASTSADTTPKLLTVTLRSTGEKDQDGQRLRQVHQLLTSVAGQDRFAFAVHEAGQVIHMDFPNSTTRWGPVLESALRDLLGADAVAVESLPSH